MSPKENDSEAREFEARARAELRRAVAETPAQIRARLEAAVERALREQPRTSRPRAWRVALPLGGIAAAACAAILFTTRQQPAPIAQPAEANAGDLALLLNVDNLDLLEQLEFYQWLDREPAELEDTGAPPAAQSS
jgi:negative regulator of sigma E activity